MITKEFVKDLIDREKPRCTCGSRFRSSNLNSYPHKGGIRLDDDKEPMWYYVSCPVCGYDTALWKIIQQIDREVE